MEKIRLGRTNMMVTKIGFGGIPIQRLNEDEAIAVVKRCIELGINFIDTANSYTTSEERIGKAIKGCRGKVILSTKSLSRNRDELLKNLHLSLKRLGVDYIDLFQFHAVHDFESLDKILEPDGLMAVIEKAQKDGIVRHIGISSHQIEVAKKAANSDRFETMMFPFNFIAAEAADELIPSCRKHDVGFICMKPMSGGMVDNANVAIKYLLQFPDIVPIPGIEKIVEMEEIVKIVESSPKITPSEKLEMKHIKEALGSRFCHRCDYCQPCTMDIRISTVMSMKSFYKRFPLTTVFSPSYSKAMDKVSNCSDCGECEKKCPYHLPIREMMKEQRGWYRDIKSQYEKQSIQ